MRRDVPCPPGPSVVVVSGWSVVFLSLLGHADLDWGQLLLLSRVATSRASA